MYDFAAFGPEDSHFSGTLLIVALVVYGLAFAVAIARPRLGAYVLGLGASLHLGAMIARGWAIGFLPLTNKMESFSTASLATAIVAVATWRASRAYATPLVLFAAAYLITALSFSGELSYPPPLMRTIWYPLHVPLSFVSYALWTAAACAGLAWFQTREPRWLVRTDHLALLGFAIWSVSMITGGIWGVVAWGAYFLWDPKVVWSVILWFYYATFAHVRLTPSLMHKPWLRPVLAWVGVILVFVAYVGTSFFFGKSSHAFG